MSDPSVPRHPRTPMPLARIPLTAILAREDDMQDVLDSGRVSDTPDDPVLVRASEEFPGLWEIADGHHRVAHALRTGHTTVMALLDPVPDDEPYEPPFYDFGAQTPVDYPGAGVS